MEHDRRVGGAPEGVRRQVGRIGLDEHPVEGCHGERVTQFLGALEGDGSGEGEVVTPVDALARKPDVTRKTVQHNLFGARSLSRTRRTSSCASRSWIWSVFPSRLARSMCQRKDSPAHLAPRARSGRSRARSPRPRARAGARHTPRSRRMPRRASRRRQAWGVVGVQGHPPRICGCSSTRPMVSRAEGRSQPICMTRVTPTRPPHAGLRRRRSARPRG